MGLSLPLAALRTFVEVARCSSIKAAAGVLHVTPGAVSQQIRMLEERIGVPLFMRERYGVRMTEAGAGIYPALLKAFEQIERTVEGLEIAMGRQTLTVSTIPSFAASWLVPRLGRFTERYPEIEVRIEATANVVDLRRDKVDLAVRHGLGQYPGLQVIRLMAPVLVPVAAPALVGWQPVIRSPVDCLHYPLLHDSERADWGLWLTAHDVVEEARSLRGPSFEDDFLLIRAAEAGQGLALIPQDYAVPEIAAGRLVQVLDLPWPSRFAYYIVSVPNGPRRAAVEAFSAWLLEEAGKAEMPEEDGRGVEETAPSA